MAIIRELRCIIVQYTHIDLAMFNSRYTKYGVSKTPLHARIDSSLIAGVRPVNSHIKLKIKIKP